MLWEQEEALCEDLLALPARKLPPQGQGLFISQAVLASNRGAVATPSEDSYCIGGVEGVSAWTVSPAN